MRKSAQSVHRDLLYRDVFENSHDAILIFRPEDEVVLEANQRAAELYGYAREELIGYSLENVSTNVAFGKSHLNATLSADTSHCFEITQLRKDRTPIMVEINASVIQYREKPAILSLHRDVTERKLAKLRFAKFLNTTHDGFWTVDQNLRILDVNNAYCRLSGYSRQELLSMRVPDLEVLESAEEVGKRAKTIIEKGVETFDGKHRRKDGSVIDFEIIVAFNREENVFYSFFRDISERKRSEMALKESEQRFRIIADTAPVMIWMSDAAGRCEYVNKFWQNFTGMTLEESLGEGWARTIHPDDRPSCLRTVGDSRQSGSSFAMQYRIRRADGAFRWVLDSGSPRFGAGGFEGHMGSCVDITEIRNAQESLRKLERAVEQTDEAIFMTDKEGAITFVNPAFEELYGFTKEETLGKTPRILKSGGYDQEFYRSFWDTLLSGKSVRDVIVNKTKDGKLLTIKASVNPVHDPEGRLTGFIAVQEDVTEIERLRAKGQKMETLASLGQMAATIAHEIRNPLAAVNLDFQYLAGRLDLKKEHADTEASIRNGIARMQRTIDTILDYARATPPECTREKIRHVLECSLTTAEKSFAAAKIQLVRNYHDRDSYVMVDLDQMFQVLTNLFSNARHAMPDGGTLTLSTADAENSVFVTIEDTGCGIHPKILNKIFDPFFTTRPNGTGLGLAVVSRVLELHDAEIFVDSRPGQGTRITLRFPKPSDRRTS